jgi:hypothetical protein
MLMTIEQQTEAVVEAAAALERCDELGDVESAMIWVAARTRIVAQALDGIERATYAAEAHEIGHEE